MATFEENHASQIALLRKGLDHHTDAELEAELANAEEVAAEPVRYVPGAIGNGPNDFARMYIIAIEREIAARAASKAA